jgi:thiamine biosynthesis lipoprotein
MSNSLPVCVVAAILFVPWSHAEPGNASLSKFTAVEPHMGTLMQIECYAHSQAQAEAAFRAAFDRIAQLDNTLSDYKPDSELNGVTATAVDRPVPVSPDLFRILAASQKLSGESGGAFDITLGPVTRLWRAARKVNRLPDPTEVHAALALCGYRKMHLDASQHTVWFEQSGMLLDAGGIAKGYAADEALAVLTKRGISSALVAASGDLAFSDAPPGQAGWKVGVDSFDKTNVPFTKVLVLANAAVSTSGDMEQHLDANGTRYSHLINPGTGIGLTKHITVTVVARRGIDADSTTKVVSILGEARGLAFIDAHPGLAALVVSSDGSRFRTVGSKQFGTLLTTSLLASAKGGA